MISVEELEINERIDPRTKEVGYVHFMKRDIKQIRFFIGSTIE